MGYYQASLKVLETVERHECCLLSKINLHPPHKAGEFGEPSLRYRADEKKEWTIALDEDGAEVEIEYCPWCGVKLPTAKS